MATLYVQQQGAMLQKRDNQIVIIKDGQTLETAPLGKIDQVVLMGRGVQISTALLVDLVERGIPVTFTNQHGSRHYFTAAPQPSHFGELRTQQMLFITTPELALELARSIVRAKLTNQRRLLESTQWPGAPTAIGQIDAGIMNIGAATTLDMVRGYEGASAAAYFGAWRIALAATWEFGGRAFYPPPDPVNAMLSFGYTLALHDVLTAVQMIGLDPYLGTFHTVEAGRPSLGLDLMEEFRPLIVDRLVLDLIGRGLITPAQFETPQHRRDAVYLNQAGRALFVDRYEAVMNTRVRAGSEQTTLRRVLLLQAQAMARIFRGEQEQYTGYTL